MDNERFKITKKCGILGILGNIFLLILKALNKNGQGTEEDVAKAINYAVSKKVNIISMSLGRTEETPLIYQAIKKAVSNNILVVCAVRIIAADIQFISPPRILVISAVGQITATAPQYGNRI